VIDKAIGENSLRIWATTHAVLFLLSEWLSDFGTILSEWFLVSPSCLIVRFPIGQFLLASSHSFPLIHTA